MSSKDVSFFRYTVIDGKRKRMCFDQEIFFGDNIFRGGVEYLRGIMLEKLLGEKLFYLSDLEIFKSALLKEGYLTQKDIDDSDSFDDLYQKIIPNWRVHDSFIITGIKEIEGCSGCRQDQPNQMAHVDCPHGCLHNKKECGCGSSDGD